MSPRNQRVAQMVRLLEGKAEDRSDDPHKYAGDEREERERQEAAVPLALVVRH
jgi:hypothetical protein